MRLSCCPVRMHLGFPGSVTHLSGDPGGVRMRHVQAVACRVSVFAKTVLAAACAGARIGSRMLWFMFVDLWLVMTPDILWRE